MKSITTSLKKIIADYGLEILDQQKRLNAILHDLHSSEKQLRFLLELSLRANIPKKIAALQSDKSSDREAQLASLKHYFKEEYFLEDVAVKSVFDCWVEVLLVNKSRERPDINASFALFPDIAKSLNEQKTILNSLIDSLGIEVFPFYPTPKIKDESTITDIEGNVYKTVKIGKQIWMAENLRVTHYRNGDQIPIFTSNVKWMRLREGGCCYYENNVLNLLTYGILYNGYAVFDKRNIAPSGWHIATDFEWDDLSIYLGGDSKTGGKLKESGKKHWKNMNFGASNESGFSALPGGYRSTGGEFIGFGEIGQWWCSTRSFEYSAKIRSVDYNSAYLSPSGAGAALMCGLSIRCVKD